MWMVMLKVARFWQNVGLGLFWFTAILKSRIWKMADKMMNKNTKNFPILTKYISIKGSLISNPANLKIQNGWSNMTHRNVKNYSISAKCSVKEFSGMLMLNPNLKIKYSIKKFSESLISNQDQKFPNGWINMAN